MTVSPEQVVERLLESFRAALRGGDVGAAFESELIADDAEIIPNAQLVGVASGRGRKGFVELFEIWTDAFVDWSLQLDEVLYARADVIVARCRQAATGKVSGIPVGRELGVVLELTEGIVTRIRLYGDSIDAMAAVTRNEAHGV